MKAIGLLLGVAGLCLLVVSPPFGGFLIVLGLLFFLAGNNTERRELEELRHQELLQAAREGKVPPK